ncbi:MAG: DUF2334 domain-containing protein [Acidimicrobiia bacterium]|nr:DUF2334 domain-containing protein [Acidimicrobiia bacterium]
MARFSRRRLGALTLAVAVLTLGPSLSPVLLAAKAATPSTAPVTWGAPGPATTLVLFDTTGPYGWLGELNAIGAGNLATHFGTVTAEPVVSYTAGQVNNFTATIYLGSTYNEPIPPAFLSDVVSTTHPVIWAGDNVWQLSGAAGSLANANFQTNYGWDPSTTYFDGADQVASVAYKGQTLTRNTAGGAVLAPHITAPSAVTVLGQANCTDTTGVTVACNEIAQTTGTTFPWAVRSGNLTFIGEVPFSYLNERDRYLAFSDLLFDALAPSAPVSHQAIVRLEDVSPGINSPDDLRTMADYLYSQNVPFSIAVIPSYRDPLGYVNNDGIPVQQDISNLKDPTIKAFDDALQYMRARGGTIIEEGYTHQYSNVANPYSGVSGDDFEFYLAHCAATFGGPLDPNAAGGCPNTDWVVQDGPVPNDSSAWAQGRAATGQAMFAPAGLPTPAIWLTPHYAASPVDYAGIGKVFATRDERGSYFGGQLTGGPVDYGHQFGQFFPYVVHDLDGSTVVPENLGDFEPDMQNNNPPRPPALIVGNAQAALTVRQGVASFFFHPYYDVSALQQIVEGMKGLGYTFVSSPSLVGQDPYVPVHTTTASLPGATVGQAYSAILTAAAGTGPYKWSITSGTLPAGLSLNAATGAITGKPKSPGSSVVTLTVTDSSTTVTPDNSKAGMHFAPAPQAATVTVTMTVGGGGSPPSSTTTTTAPSGGNGRKKP